MHRRLLGWGMGLWGLLACGSSNSSTASGGTDGGGAQPHGGSSAITTGRDPASGQCPVQGAGSTCPEAASFQKCLVRSCDGAMKVCFGENYEKGDYAGGLCKAYMECLLQCPCDGSKTACESACGRDKTITNNACLAAVQNAYGCMNRAPCDVPACVRGQASSGGTGTGTVSATCREAKACCLNQASREGSSLGASSCNSIDALSEADCQRVLTSWKSDGTCP